MFWSKKGKTEKSDLDSTMIELGREIERGLLAWWALPSNHWHEMEGNLYHKGVNLMARRLLDDKKITDADRVKGANELLEFSKAYRERLNGVGLSYKKFIETRLAQFDEMLQPLLKLKLHDKEKEWLKLSRDLCKIREREMFAVNIHIDTDEFIPNLFIQDNGKPDHKMTDEENKYFKEKLVSYGALRAETYENEKKIEPHRSNLAESMFGKLGDYIKDGSYFRLQNELIN